MIDLTLIFSGDGSLVAARQQRSRAFRLDELHDADDVRLVTSSGQDLDHRFWCDFTH